MINQTLGLCLVSLILLLLLFVVVVGEIHTEVILVVLSLSNFNRQNIRCRRAFHFDICQAKKSELRVTCVCAAPLDVGGEGARWQRLRSEFVEMTTCGFVGRNRFL